MKYLFDKIANKYKENGILGIADSIRLRIISLINTCLFYKYQKKYPIQENLIVLESEGDLSDNAYALFDYMNCNGYLQKYHIIWLVENMAAASKKVFQNTEYLPKYPKEINTKWAKGLATCKYYIYDHCNIMGLFYKRKEQKLIYLSHGAGFKAPTFKKNRDKSHCDIITITGKGAEKGIAKFAGEPLNKIVITGYPRLDYLFKNDISIYHKVCQKWNFNRYDKVVYWMPTFRQSINQDISEEYINNETGLPFFNTKEDLQDMSEFLQSYNILLVLKLHHLQADLPIFGNRYENVLVVHDEELQQMNIQLYQFIKFADALITDYSSIYIDYLLLDRPVIFTLDDYEEYDKSRGFYPKNAIDYMKGYHVYTRKELMDSLLEIKSGIDKYKKGRRKVRDLYHKYQDGRASARVLQIARIMK